MKIHNQGNVDAYFERTILDGFVSIDPMHAMIIDSHKHKEEKRYHGLPSDSLFEEFKNAIQRITTSGVIDEPGGQDGIVIDAKRTAYIRISFFEKKQAGIRWHRSVTKGPLLESVSMKGIEEEIEGFNPDPELNQLFHYEDKLHMSRQLPRELRSELKNGELMLSVIASGKVFKVNPNNILPVLICGTDSWKNKNKRMLYDEQDYDMFQPLPSDLLEE